MRKKGITKTLMSLFVMLVVVESVQSQVKVTNNGNFGIGTSNPLSKLSVNADGSSLFSARIANPSTASGSVGLYVTNSVLSPGGGGNIYKSVVGSITSGNGFAFGLYGESMNQTPRSNGRAVGVYGSANNATNGYNYGVFGALSGSNNGAAVYGTTNLNQLFGENTEGKFAGFFVGNVYVHNSLLIGKKSTSNYSLDVDGDACVTSLYESSDARLKENVTGISSALGNLKQLRGVSFNFKNPDEKTAVYSKAAMDTGTVKVNQIVNNKRYAQKRIGFIAQEIQLLYPELVREGIDGMLAVDYNGLIPVIVEAIKEQDSIICVLKSELENLKTTALANDDKSRLKSTQSNSVTTNATLYQNTPNPFNVSTDIKYYLPEEVQQAIIYVFNMQGTLQMSEKLIERGFGQMTVNASDLKPGMYLYSLVVDGKEIDTKKLILTE